MSVVIAIPLASKPDDTSGTRGGESGPVRCAAMKWRRKPQPVPQQPSAPARKRNDWRSWDAVAADYERVVAPHTATLAPLIRSVAGLSPGARILDVGCGTGAAFGADPHAVGCDPSIGMLTAGRDARPDATLVAADTINLPFADGSFDVATAAFSLDFAPKLETALFDIKRVVRAGGTLVIVAWENELDDLTRTWLQLAERTLGVEMFRHARKDAQPWAELLGNKAKLETALRDAGFRPVTISREKVRLEMSLEDYLTEKHVAPLGRFVREMLRDRWTDFRTQERAAYAERFGAHVVDMRDVLIASATKP
jgi:ubiquinone/menaquinone biosynthesis C-methylase UbiE